MRPVVSVVIPTHNRAGLIGDAIDSVLRQTYTNIEVIVVDNGSTDATRERVLVVAERDDRVRYYHQENSGSPVGPRNRAVGLALGDYVAFLDSDDLWLPAKLEKQMARFESDSKTAIVYSDFFMIDDSGERGATYFSLGTPHRGSVYPELLVKNFIPNSTAVVKKSAYLDGGGQQERYKIGHDWDLWLKIAENSNVAYVDEPLSEIRMHSGSMSARRQDLFEELIDIVREREPGAVADPRIGPRRFGAILARYYYRHGVYSFLDGDRRAGRRSLGEALRLDKGNAIYLFSYLISLIGPWPAGPIFRFAGKNKGVFVK